MHQWCPFLHGESLVVMTHVMVTSWLDNCNACYMGLPWKPPGNYNVPTHPVPGIVCPSYTMLCDLSCFPVTFWMQFKVMVIMFKVLHGRRPSYLWNHFCLRVSYLFFSSPLVAHRYTLPPGSCRLSLLYPSQNCEMLDFLLSTGIGWVWSPSIIWFDRLEICGQIFLAFFVLLCILYYYGPAELCFYTFFERKKKN